MIRSNKKSILILLSAVTLIAVAVANMNLKRDHFNLPAKIDFNFHVKPILVQKCYLCHGPDPSSRKGGLRLDTYEGATALLKSGNHAINKEHPDISELLSRIEHKDPDMVMPPPDSKMLLTEREKAILSKWIEQGAEWKPHWAFIMPDTSVFEKVKNKSTNPIDFFIDEQLDKNDLKPSAEAGKNTMIRRASYLLTGLPPSVEEIDQFIADKSPDAYEKMIDHYLSSKTFGERWARHWMDVVRYAETKGHEFDYAIEGAWRYRDYLIRCFNNDVGYDKMVKEQLAGDLLTEPRRNPIDGTNESQLGTMFLTMAEGAHSPVDIRQDEADRIDNMIDVTTKSFQSLTVSCARCHDHKFDPIPTKDYYSLFGVMESTRFSPVSATTGLNEEKKIQDIEKWRKNLRESISTDWLSENKLSATNTSSFQTINSKPIPIAASYTMIGDFRNNDFGNWKSDGLAFGKTTTLGNPVFDEHTGKFLYLDEGKASSRKNGVGIFGALRSPNFTITDDSILVQAKSKNATIRIIIDNFQLIQDPIYGGISRNVTSDKWENVIIDVSSWKGHNAYIELLPGVYQQHTYRQPSDSYIDVRYVISYNGKTPVIPYDQPLERIALPVAINHWQSGNCSEQDVIVLNQNIKKGTLRKVQLTDNSFLKVPDSSISNKPDNTDFYNGVYDGFAINSPVFIRGSYKQTSADRIPRHFFSALHIGDSVFHSDGSGRLELAESILSSKNPLTARVMVNRIWHYLFGKGIVETVDNFGLQGKLPSNPELLDYLAIRFQKDNWSIKKMIKLIVLSKAFQRSTEATADMQKKDPSDTYLAYFPVLRLEAEAIRDALLTISGRLDTTLYGTPVPVHLTTFMNGRGKPDTSGPVDGAGRRSIYQEVRRNFLEPMMLTFDRPIPFSTFGNRNVTNVPAQSLFLMNDSFVVEQADLLAKKVIKLKNTTDDRIALVYKLAFSRTVSDDEISKAKIFLQRLSEIYKANGKNDITAIWKDYCQSLLNSKEFIFLT
ncbi:MAG: PSD1 and planctomycete cytochrome C domain-containing protein [Chitinophagaceae bacterium]